MQSTRSKVIEKSVQLEELMSLLLSNFLDIKKEESISFGTKSFALSFNSKINLLSDMKILPLELKQNLILFAEIRNKFAHVLYVDSFTKCFEVIYSNSANNSSKNKLLAKGKTLNQSVDTGIELKPDKLDLESELSTCFEFLCLEIDYLIKLTSEYIHIKKAHDLKKTVIVEILRKSIDSNEMNLNDSLKNLLNTLLSEIVPDKEFNLKYEELLNENN